MTTNQLARLVCTAVAVLFLFVSSAAGSATWVMSGGLAAYDGGGQVLAYGVQANSYLYPKQTSQDDDWVNSLYARQDDGDFFEAGWYWASGATRRTWFSKLRRNGISYGETWFPVSDQAAGGWPTIQIRRSGTSGDTYLVYVAGVLRTTEYSTGMTSCRASVGAERFDTLDYNKGSWTYIKYLSGSNVWAYWPNALHYVGGAGMVPSDSGFPFWSNHIDHYDHHVYCDDHQN